MDYTKDDLGNDLKPGCAVIVESNSAIYLGRISHYSKAGNIIAHLKPSYRNIGYYTRVVLQGSAAYKIIITRDPQHINAVKHIEIKNL